MKSSAPLILPEEIDPNWKIGIVRSSWHAEITSVLEEQAKKALLEAGIRAECISVYSAPGSFEIPLIGAALAKKKSVDALIGFGVILEGETHHAALLAEQVARGMMDVQVQYVLPFAFEVLYVRNLSQATERASGENNKGREAAHAVLHSLAQLSAV